MSEHEEKLQLKSDFVELSLKTKLIFTERSEITIELTRDEATRFAAEMALEVSLDKRVTDRPGN